jgi:hypothetical protein
MQLLVLCGYWQTLLLCYFAISGGTWSMTGCILQKRSCGLFANGEADAFYVSHSAVFLTGLQLCAWPWLVPSQVLPYRDASLLLVLLLPT